MPDRRRGNRNYESMFTKYGLRPEDFERMLEEQGGVCAICDQPETARSQWGSQPARLCIDHDHQTGANRGLLCRKCNRALGLLGDSIEGLARALAYLQRTREVTV